MRTAIFITEDYLKENTIINGNVDFKYILANLKMVEDMYIQTILGTNMYRELNQQIIANTVTSANAILIEEYIQPTMIYYLLSELPYDMVYKWENKSIVKKNSDNSQSIELNELEKIAAKKLNVAMFYAQRLSDYLCANLTLYPAYATTNGKSDEMKPRTSMYNYGGIYLGRKRAKTIEEKYNNTSPNTNEKSR